MKGGFSEKKRIFDTVLLQTGDFYKAVEASGYKESYAKRFLNDENVKKIIEEHKSVNKASDDMSVVNGVAENEEILKFLTNVMRGDNNNSSFEGSIRERMRAAELLSKRKQFFDDSQNESINVLIIDDIKWGGFYKRKKN